MNCDICKESEAEYFIKKTPPGMEAPKQQLHLCSDCAGKYIQRDTVSVVRIARNTKEE